MNRTAWAFAIATVASSTSYAQAGPGGVGIGDQVRFKLASTRASSDGTNSPQCEGRVTGLLFDTVVVRPFEDCGINGSLVRVIELQRQKRLGSRTSHMLWGLLYGAIGGGIAGGVIAGDGCRPGGCDDGGLAVVEYMLTGLTAGGIVGASIGFALPAGTRWRSIAAQLVRLEYVR